MELTPEDKMVLTGLVAAELYTLKRAREELWLKKTGLATLLDRQIAHLEGLQARLEGSMSHTDELFTGRIGQIDGGPL